MIHNDIQNQLQLLIKTSAPPLIEVADHALGTPQWTPGQQIPAHVLATLPNGRFQVQVGDQVLDLNLPRNTQPGESLELTYVSNSPRLTFALLRDVPASLPANTPNTPVSLSDTAKFIGNLLQGNSTNPTQATNPAPTQNQAQASGQPQAASQFQPGQVGKLSAAPMITVAPADVPAFAQALRASVSQSGLFYEAHQVQWLNGERSLTSLRQEPQGQLAPLRQNGQQHLPVVARADTALPLTQAPSATAPSPSVGGGDKLAVEGGVHPQAVPLVQQQLQALDTRQVVWQGQVWPGQQMNWAIEEELARQGGQQDDDLPTWHTRLNLQLPTLGGVSAKLAFVKGAVQLDISAEDSASASLMQRNQAELAERFLTSGLQLSGVTIQHG